MISPSSDSTNVVVSSSWWQKAPLYPQIVIKEGEELVIWGVVTRNLHKLY